MHLKITYAGGEVVSPVLPDDAGQLQAYLDSLANLSDVRPWGNDNPSGDSYLPQEFRWNGGALPTANETSPLRLRLNSVYYPTGAKRWGVACFAVAGDWFKLPDSTQVSLSFGGVTLANWWPVHRRQITPDLSLFVCADDRYRWHWSRTPATFTFDETTTWTDVITLLSGALGKSITYPTIDYVKPDAVELNRRCASIPELLDAVALSMGLRVVVAFDGSIQLQSTKEAELALAARLVPDRINGIRTMPMPPAKITVAFTRAQSGAFDQTARMYEKTWEYGTFDDKFDAVTGSDFAVRCTYPAEYRLLETDPENKDQLDVLACRIARDCYQWIKLQDYDYTCPGIAIFPPTGADDFLAWVLGDRGPSWQADSDPEYLIATRYASRPANSLPDTVYAGEGKPRYSGSGVMRVVLDEPVSATGETRAKLVSINTNGSLTIDERVIKVTKPNHPLVIGPMPDSGRFEFLSAEVATGNETGSGGSPTTTAQDCTGRTKWNWDGYEWTVLDNQCGQAFTTTTTTAAPTTTAGATTTAAPTTTCDNRDPCCRLANTTTVAPTTTAGATTTAAPTTTAAGGCRPQYPTFCPDVSDVGACTWTFCADGESAPPSCQSTTAAPTTTAAGTGPPTTTGAPTTTAGCPSDCLCPTGGSGCHWISLPLYGGGWYWHKTNEPCCVTCPCSEPSRVAQPCDEEWTDCVPLPPPDPIPEPYCVGECQFWWIPEMSRWFLTDSNCVGFRVPFCNCTYPTVDGDICAPVITKCKGPATTTASRIYDPCFPTTTAGATTTAAPTTTPACGLGCYWECASAVWSIADNLCNAGCECYEPPINCVEDCEREFTPCRSTTTTAGPTTTHGPTTTAAPTTTGAPTTTASDCVACSGACSWRWYDNRPSGFPGWSLMTVNGDSGCASPCGCLPPLRSGAYDGEVISSSCWHQCDAATVGSNRFGCTFMSFDSHTWTQTGNCGDPYYGCHCAQPAYPPRFVNEVAFGNCGCL